MLLKAHQKKKKLSCSGKEFVSSHNKLSSNWSSHPKFATTSTIYTSFYAHMVQIGPYCMYIKILNRLQTVAAKTARTMIQSKRLYLCTAKNITPFSKTDMEGVYYTRKAKCNVEDVRKEHSQPQYLEPFVLILITLNKISSITQKRIKGRKSRHYMSSLPRIHKNPCHKEDILYIQSTPRTVFYTTKIVQLHYARVQLFLY